MLSMDFEEALDKICQATPLRLVFDSQCPIISGRIGAISAPYRIHTIITLHSGWRLSWRFPRINSNEATTFFGLWYVQQSSKHIVSSASKVTSSSIIRSGYPEASRAAVVPLLCDHDVEGSLSPCVAHFVLECRQMSTASFPPFLHFEYGEEC